MSTKKSLIHLGFWIGMALIFNAGIYIFMGHEKALAFLGGYVIEQSLSLDNLFLFLIIFECFAVNPQYQKTNTYLWNYRRNNSQVYIHNLRCYYHQSISLDAIYIWHNTYNKWNQNDI